ncbi:FAD dependent oxidoreductase [Mariniphaga anaerophila]|uniref:FAD dependent oxidoreductase n=1 Tax=Mariniphaga anaerophila TaxID=1484053 RepID=A0A1M4VV43_9BACT|nr:FAD-dependent oxidoreductase [Mariniphaga anaerophila]SHE72856.1 FAD dependent oxidoreductase [Mariniphaga anaerophila]
MRGKIILTVFLLINQLITNASANNRQFVWQSQREIKVVKSVDVIIIGGTVSAVAAAVSASKKGADVFLVAPRPYLGEDMCATLQLKTEKNRKLNSSLEKKLFGDTSEVTPLKVKSILNQALVDANVDFIFSSYVTDVLRDGQNNPSGVIVANRAGRQAIAGKVLIDATDRAWVARMAGAEAYEWSGKEIEFQRTVVMPGKEKNTPQYVTHKLNIPMPNLHFSSFARAEQIARKNTYTSGQLRASESLFCIPPDPIICEKDAKKWKEKARNDLRHFQPKKMETFFVLSGCADIPRAVADSLLKPAAMAQIAEEIGIEAAEKAKQKSNTLSTLSIKSTPPVQKSAGDVKELLQGLRPVDKPANTIVSHATDVPVLADYDVVVIGGGTTGAPAAIAAGWWGMKVLVVEYLEGLGGIGTLGLIGKPWHGYNIGFAAEVPFPDGNAEPKMEWYRSQIEKVGGDIWLGAIGSGAYTEGNTVKGAVVCTPEGRGIVRAKVVIDATGSAEVAIAAGADYMFGDIETNHIALQGTGMSSRPLEGNYYNSDYLLVDETDVVDIWRSLVSVQNIKASENIYDAVPIIQSRERKRIVGDYIISYLDQVAERTFPDVIVISSSTYDSHGYPSSPYFALLPHDSISRKMNQPAPGGTCFTPYRCLLPKNFDGIIVTGLGISMERDATAMIRMQLDLANQGYAAGVAAMLAITNEVQPRNINIKELQKILIKKGNLPDSVLTLEDSFPLPTEKIKEAVKAYGNATNPTTAGKPLAIMLSHKNTALPMVKKEYKNTSGRSKLRYALFLGICGEKEAVPTLLAELENFSGWDEKIYQGSMADYAHLPTPIDAIILAIGYSGDKSGLPKLLDLTDKLDSSVTLSHHRSIALALEKMGDKSAAVHLAKLLKKPGMQGHAMLSLDNALTELDNDGKGPNPVKNSSYEKRTRALREIILARVLYECGDYNGLGESILKNYQKDLRGLFIRHANKILTDEL